MSNGIIFRGYRRVFFLVLALALFMQITSFAYNRTQTARNAVTEDFKIILLLPNASLEEAQNFAAQAAANVDITAAAVLNTHETLVSLRENNPQTADNVAAIMDNFLPQHITLTVTTQVMLNPQVWLQQNILDKNPEVSATYKPQQVQVALYLNGMQKLISITLLLALFALLTFGFFVEAYYTKTSPFKERAGGVFSAFIAYGISLAVIYALAYPLNKMAVGFNYSLFNWHQAVVVILCSFMGLTLAKWKKF